MDAIEVLKHDHRMVEQLFRDYDAVGGPPGGPSQRRGVVEVMVRELSKHAALEELLFYPFAREVLPGDGDRLVDSQLTGHMVVKQLLRDLDGLPEDHDDEARLMQELREAVTEHINDEEGDLMPRVQDVADRQQLLDLGRTIDEAKSTAPTRPHPAAPDKPPILAVAAPLVAAYDRARDRLQGRPKT